MIWIDQGAKGIKAYITRICGFAGSWLAEELLEHGYQQGAAVRQLLQQSEYNDIQTYKDLAGHERATFARKNGSQADIIYKNKK